MGGRLRRYGLGGLILVLALAGILRLAAGPSAGGGHGFELGGAFTLTGADGRPVTESDWPGRRLLIDFGYRFCPDVCPATLQTMAAALDLLGADGARVQPLFVSLDPERDRPETLPAYVALFHPRLIGLTGTPEQIAQVARRFRIYYARVAGASPESYTIDHSAYVFLTDDHGRVLKIFGANTPAAAMAGAIRPLLPPP